MKKKILLWTLKMVTSGILALAILTGFCFFYYNIPIHSDTADGASDYAWEHNKFYSRCTEGFSWGKTNNEGYLNSFDYTDGMNIDVLIMGSSHIEAYNVGMSENTAAQLQAKLPDRTVYNIGTSNHGLLNCADNLKDAVEKYAPSQYVIIETATVRYTDEKLLSVLTGEVEELQSHSGGILGLLQKNQYLRLLYSQVQFFIENAKKANTSSTQNETKELPGADASYDAMLSFMSETVESAGAKLVIMYHPLLTVNEDGSVSAASNDEPLDQFKAICEKNDIIFLDMSDRFIKNYAENNVLPHGFTNTSVGKGHLNKHGHAIIAEALYDIVKEES